MNKIEFLNELEKRIRVLEKNEIKDILGEYSQHIDMRMESGLSEADAIKDFGTIEELTAEILEAYHVNPEYESESIEQGEKVGEVDKKSFGKCARKFVGKFIGLFAVLSEGIKKMVKGVANALKKLFEKIKILFSKFFGLFKGKLKKENKTVEIEKKHETKKKSCVKEGIKGVFKKLMYIILVLFVIMCFVPVAILSIGSVFALGFTVVMLFQGYPLFGVLMFCAGTTVSSIALCGLLISLVYKSKKTEDDEVDYEVVELKEEEEE